jgi:hypothetical protein
VDDSEQDNGRNVGDASLQPENSGVAFTKARQQQSSKFQQSMIAAVYVDHSLKQHIVRRALSCLA